MINYIEKSNVIADEVIINKIIIIRNQKVMIDSDLAGLYDVSKKRLNEIVKRNGKRFPSDFMFELSENEINSLVSQNVIPSKKQLGGAVPYAFTEPGVAMLSSILKSQTAVNVNIAIMRTFVKLRKTMLNYSDIVKWQADIDKKLGEHDDKLLLIFEYLKQFEQRKIQELEQQNRPKIGFKQEKEGKR